MRVRARNGDEHPLGLYLSASQIPHSGAGVLCATRSAHPRAGGEMMRAPRLLATCSEVESVQQANECALVQ